jgi:hypothetical protein
MLPTNQRLFLERDPFAGDYWIRRGTGPKLEDARDVAGPYLDVAAASRHRDLLAKVRGLTIQVTGLDRQKR